MAGLILSYSIGLTLETPQPTQNFCAVSSCICYVLASLTSLESSGVINGKTGKAAALPKFLDKLTLSQSGGADYAKPLALPHLKISVITPLERMSSLLIFVGKM